MFHLSRDGVRSGSDEGRSIRDELCIIGASTSQGSGRGFQSNTEVSAIPVAIMEPSGVNAIAEVPIIAVGTLPISRPVANS